MMSLLYFPAQMSKSRGNIVEPLEQFDMFGVDEVRYFMLKRGCLQRDAGMDELQGVSSPFSFTQKNNNYKAG